MAFGASAASGASLQVEVVPKFNGAPLVFDSLTNQTVAGQALSVTRLDFLLSNFAFRREDGVWFGLTNGFAYISAREGRTRFRLSTVGVARYDRVRFHVGLTPEINHKDPAEFPAAHPLNPEVNGLHWGWTGGYVFLALEGSWLAPDGRRSGYSYHLATDRQLMTAELPVTLDGSSDCELQLTLNLERIFATPNAIVLEEATATTHSRTNDSLASQLRANLEQAFVVAGTRSTVSPISSADGVTDRKIGDGAVPLNATPYRLVISRFFPRPALPVDNPLTEEGVALGRALFHDRRLSINNRQSCASCHDFRRAGADPRGALSAGAEGKFGTRNAMPLFNLAWRSSFFWDGRAATLREQVLQPIQNPLEMHETLTNVVAKLQSAHIRQSEEALTDKSEIRDPKSEIDYPVLFTAAFGSAEINADRIARALEQFLLTQTSHDSKFDRVLIGEAKFTGEEQRGFELFHTEYDPRREQFGADCFHCHSGPFFQSQTFANNGLDAEFKDLGRHEVTRKDGDKGKFAVPSLRNVAVTAPYMHDGRFNTLEEVVRHYSSGVKRSATLDPNLAKHPDGGVPLSEADQRALVAFLKTFTGEQFHAKTPTLAATPP